MINLVCLIQESFDKPEDQNKMNPPWHQNNPMKNLQSNPHSRVGVFHDLGNSISIIFTVMEAEQSGLQVFSDDVDPVVLTQTCAYHSRDGEVGHGDDMGNHPRSPKWRNSQPNTGFSGVSWEWGYTEKGMESDYAILVGGIPTPLKNMKVSWDDEIPNIWQNKKCSKPPIRIIMMERGGAKVGQGLHRLHQGGWRWSH